MGTASADTFREFTIRPGEEAEVSVEPDGTIELLWREAGVTLLLSPTEADKLAKSVNSAVVFGGIGA